ncbi:tRNA (adenosine(37)-N6)-dimethylallyltransferase MiaA [Candidatus Babeliales bacterium]|nr:tRNA (adenosine(37)-N6)-dimethylallyltransferase MiaA [Candidatus Babeliales bacterium]
MKDFVVIISGATASGKSDLALKIAQEINGEIVNADIGSMYQPLIIGTAKPDWRSEKNIHHLFDIIDQPKNFTVTQFRDQVEKLIRKIWKRDHVPIIVGGSAFYIKALFYKQHEIPDSSKIVANLEQQIALGMVNGLDLWQRLHQIDALRAKKIHPHDTYRLIRALAIFETTGKPPCEFEQIFQPLAPFYFIICKHERQKLYQRIDARVHTMIDQGWVQEVQKLQNTEWEKFLINKKLIGYDDLLKYLQQKKQENFFDVVSLIQQKTRNYAKRQIIFLNKLESDLKKELDKGQIVGSVQDINLTYCDVGLYIKGLSNRILQTLS